MTKELVRLNRRFNLWYANACLSANLVLDNLFFEDFFIAANCK